MKVQEFFTSSKKWIKGTMYANSRGQAIGYRDSKISRCCLLGAINHCYRRKQRREAIRAKVEEYIKEKYQAYSIVNFNDRTETKFKDIKKIINILKI